MATLGTEGTAGGGVICCPVCTTFEGKIVTVVIAVGTRLKMIPNPSELSSSSYTFSAANSVVGTTAPLTYF